MNYIDTHFHLDLFKNPKKVIEDLERNKIYCIAVTNLPDLFEISHLLTKDQKYVRAALGYHPELSGQYNDKIEFFKKHIDKTRFVGEVGLDFSKQYDKDNQRKQVKIFGEILEIISNKNKIVTIHSRNSASHVIDIVGNNFDGTPILHWFSGNLTQAKKALDAGFYFSFNRPMLRSNKGQELLNYLPLDRVLTETDAPFTTNMNKYDLSSEVRNLFFELNKSLKNSTGVQERIYLNFKSILKEN